MLNNEASAALSINLLSPVSAANTAAATGAWIDIGTTPLEGYVMFTLNIGALTGSMTSLIQDADDGVGTNLATVANSTFAAAVTNTVQKVVVLRTGMRRFIRFIGTVVTGPVLLSVTAHCRAKTV